MSRLKTEYTDFIMTLILPIVILIGLGGYALQIIGGSIITALVVTAGILGVLFIQIVYTNSTYKTYALVAVLLGMIIYIGISFFLFKDGLAATFNSLIESYKEINPYNYLTLYVSTKNVRLAKTIFMIWLAFVSGAGLALSIRKQSNIALIATGLVWVASISFFYEKVSPFWVAFAAVVLAMWLFHNRTYKGMQTYEAVLSGDLAIFVRTIVISLIVVLVFNIALPSDSYTKSSTFSTIEDFAEETLERIRYGEEAKGLTGGKLYKAESLERSDDVMLEVTMDTPDSYYLRGFVGEIYQNSQWKPLESNKLYDSLNMFYWLHMDNFYGLNQLENLALNEDPSITSSNMTVTNKGASSKYIYAPYEVASDTSLLDINGVGDAALKSESPFGKKSYELSVIPNQVKRYQYLSSSLIEAEAKGKAQNYIKNESYYNEFVYENYTSVTPEIASLLSEYLGQYAVAEGESHFDYQMAKQNITFFMTNKMEYSENTQATGKDIDFILNFIEGTKQGYDIHFASAATMMFRYYGIPARYVEGFLITKDDVKNAKAGEPISIDGTHAHAWVEYYHDGIGWLPFEVTPTYLNIMENPDTLKNISSLLGQYQGEDKTLEEEEEKEPQTEDGIQSFLIKYKMLIILFALSLLVAVLISLFIWWLVRERRKVAARIASFDDENAAKGICNIFDYMIDLLLAWGLEPAKGMLGNQAIEINRLMDEDLTEEYLQIVEIRQEAKYSQHSMTEDDRTIVRNFEESIKQKMWQEASAFQKLKYKYMYFL